MIKKEVVAKLTLMDVIDCDWLWCDCDVIDVIEKWRGNDRVEWNHLYGKDAFLRGIKSEQLMESIELNKVDTIVVEYADCKLESVGV